MYFLGCSSFRGAIVLARELQNVRCSPMSAARFPVPSYTPHICLLLGFFIALEQHILLVGD
jgi:hypothetical protein